MQNSHRQNSVDLLWTTGNRRDDNGYLWYMYLYSCMNSPFGDGAYGFGPWRRWLTPARSLPRCELSGSYTLNLAYGHGGHGEGVKT